MKVLFCTDGSDASFYAIRKALPFLSKNSDVSVLYVIDWGLFPTYVTFPHEEEEGFPDQRSSANDILDKTTNIIEMEGYKISKSYYTSGNPANIILDAIEEEKYDLAVLGSHGKKGIGSWLGSVSRKVVSKSPIPTFISRPPKKDEKESLKGVLFSVDGSESSYNSIKRALNLLDVSGYSIEVITVKPGTESLPVEITMDNEWLERSLVKQEEIAKEILDESKKIFEMYGFENISAFSIEGDPADTILKYTSKNPRDLVVMGSHGREGISELLLGSVSKRVLDHLIGSVLIVPTRNR